MPDGLASDGTFPLNQFLFREAVASVALSHDEGCTCRTCRAAGGDDKLLVELMVEAMAREAQG